MSDANEFNREMRQREVEAQYERALSGFEQARKDRRQRAEATNELLEEEREQQFEKRQSRREHEQAMEEIRARGRQRRKTDRTGGGGSQDDDAGVTLPDTIGATEQKIDELIRKEQRMLDQGASNSQLRDVQEKIVGLKRHRDVLRRRQQIAPDSTGAPADTARTDTTVSRRGYRPEADTTEADTTRTRGIGGRPGGMVPPQQLGMTTGGGGGGGNTDPSHAVTQLEDVGGSGLGARSTEQLVEDALTVARQRSPDEARRRLDRLAEQGQLSPDRAAQIQERMAAVRELDRIATERGPQVALDTLDVMRREGDITPQQARRLKSRVRQRHARR